MATYTIDSVQDLIDLTLLSGKFAGVLWKDNFFNLTTDLDLTNVDVNSDGKGWLPIGYWGAGAFFNGAFDGQGHTISNMTINRPDNDNGVGLFGAIDPDSDGATWDHDQVKNLALVNVNVSGGISTGGLTGVILSTGIAHGYSINNCYVAGIVQGVRRVGGFVGYSNNGYFLNCYTEVAVDCLNSQCEIGGFIGYDTIGSDCVNCYSMGAVTVSAPITEDTNVGGFVGKAADVYATNTFFDTQTSGKDTDGTNGDAVGKTTAQMKQEATFTNWDFTNDWWITAGETYPALRVFGGVPGLPTKASNPSPVDDATNVAIDVSLSWSKDSGDNVLVYFDKKSENDPPTTKVIDDEEAILYDPPSNLVYSTIYVWRVDTKNEEGTTTGDQWEFTMVSLEEPEPEPEEIVLVKGNNLIGTLQITNPQIIGEGDFSDDVCPQGQDCDDKCNLTNVPNEYHPGTKDSIINF